MRRGLRDEQAVVLKQDTEFQQGGHAQTRLRGVLHLAASQGIEHPRGKSNLEAIGELNDQTIRGLTPEPADNLYWLSKEGMMGVTDASYRRMMSRVTMSAGTRSPRSCWKPATIFGPCRNCSGIET